MDSPTARTRPVLLWALLCLALGIAAVVTGVLRYDALPENYPTHFGFSGEPDAFGTKSWGTVLGPIVIGQLSALVIFAITLAVPGKGAGIRAPLAALGCAIGGGVSLMCLSGYVADDAVPSPWVLWAFLTVTLAATVWLVVVSVRTGRVTWRTTPTGSTGTSAAWSTPTRTTRTSSSASAWVSGPPSTSDVLWGGPCSRSSSPPWRSSSSWSR